MNRVPENLKLAVVAIAISAVLMTWLGACSRINDLRSVGASVTEHETERLVCGVALFADSISVSCVEKSK